MLDRQVGDDARAVDVVADALAGIVLHHRDVLVGCGVEHVVGAARGKEFVHALLHADVGDDGLRIDAGPLPRHHQADVVQGRLGLVDEGEPGWGELCHLPDYFAADTAGRAGDEDGFASELRLDGIEVDLYLLTGQQVLDVNFFELGVAQITLAVPLLQAGIHADFHACLEQPADHLGVVADGIIFQRRDEQGLCLETLHLPHEVLVVGIDLDSHQVAARHIRMV